MTNCRFFYFSPLHVGCILSKNNKIIIIIIKNINRQILYVFMLFWQLIKNPGIFSEPVFIYQHFLFYARDNTLYTLISHCIMCFVYSIFVVFIEKAYNRRIKNFDAIALMCIKNYNPLLKDKEAVGEKDFNNGSTNHKNTTWVKFGRKYM